MTFPSPTPTWHNSVYPSIDPTRPELSLAGKSVVITGGGSGIGLAISKALALAGASQLAIIGRRVSVLTQAAAEINALVGKKTEVFTVSADVSNKSQIDEAFSRISTAFGGKSLDLLVNNAGYFTGMHTFGTETLDQWNTAIDINIKGVYIVTTAFIAKAKEDATIVNVSTAIAHLPGSFRSGFSSYAATKLAGSKIIDYLHAENPSLHVVEIHPGQVTETEMARKLGGQMTLPHIDDGTFVSYI